MPRPLPSTRKLRRSMSILVGYVPTPVGEAAVAAGIAEAKLTR